MELDRIWLGHLSPENRSLVYKALRPYASRIRETPCPEAAAALTPEGGLGILILEGPAQSVTSPLPTLWILPPAAPPTTEGMELDEFVRLPASPEEILRRTRDLARAMERERTLRRLEEEVAKHPEHLRGVVTTIGHDLFSPLTAVLEYLELLLDGTVGSPTPQQQKLLAAAQQTTRALAERIEEIADASRAEVGLAVDVHLAPTGLGPLVADLQEWAVSRLAEKKQELAVDLDPATPDVCGDSDRLRQVLRHLVKNAHHFSPVGGRIEVCIAPDPEVVGFVLMTVSDTGEGIAPAEYAGSLDPFGAVASQAGCRPHLGIGLALVRAIVAALGGEIDVANGPASGSVIAIRIPVWASRAARISEAQVELTAPRDIPESAWLCRACGEKEIAALGDSPVWRTLSPGEILAISEDPPERSTRLGRVGDFRQVGSLLSALQPCLRVHEAAREKHKEVV